MTALHASLLLIFIYLPHCHSQPHWKRPSLRSLISGGSNADFQSFPYVCSIRHRTSGRHFCGGVLLSPRSILTAAYCVSPVAFNLNPEVWCGDIQDINNSSRGAVDALRAVKTTLHECYDPKRYFNDIAVLELNASVVHGNPIENIITVEEFEKLQSGDQLIGLGWGETGAGGDNENVSTAARYPQILQQAVLPFISDQACNAPESYNNTVDSDLMFCAGYFDARADSCAGDSGGPLVQQQDRNANSNGEDSGTTNNNTNTENSTVTNNSTDNSTINSTDTLVGIVSWGSGCAIREHPGVYARVDVHHDWIVLHSHCACSSENFSFNRTGGNSNSSECILEEESGEFAAVQHKADMSAAGAGLCYVVNFEKCPLATASQVYPGEGWLPCRKNSQGEIETIHNATACSFKNSP